MIASTGRLASKTALVTGGGRGIGRAIALRFAAEGARVAILEPDQDAADATAEAIRHNGGVALALGGADVRQPEDVERAITQTVARFGPITILINNAGIAGYSGGFLDLPLTTWHEVIGVNLTGMFVCGQAVARQMVAHGVGGRIVNLGSINSFGAERDAAAYVASKGGVLGLTRAMAVDLAPHGIAANCLAPGPITVERNADLFGGAMRTPIANVVPLGRPGTVDEVAAAALFLAEDEASYINGAALLVDGGTLAYLHWG